jgi:hypothetical protein
MRAALVLALACAFCRTAAAQPADESDVRAFGVVRLGPVGQIVVHAPTRELEGAPTATPGLGLRVDQRLRPNLLVGFDFSVHANGENMLKPYGTGPDGSVLRLGGVVLDGSFSIRPMLPLARGVVELFASAGVGLTVRPDLTGELPFTDAHGRTETRNVSATGWGVLAQLGVGAMFWMSDRIVVFIESAAVMRRLAATSDDEAGGDYTLVVDEAHFILLSGVGATWSSL